MANWRSIMVAITLFVVIVAGVFTLFQVADLGEQQAAATENTVTNESLIQQVGVYQLVNKSTERYTAGFNHTVTVYNNSSVELTEGEDYEWNATDGAIKFLDTNSTNDGQLANITYQYEENTEAVKDMSGPIDVMVTGTSFVWKMVAGLGFAVIFFAGVAILIRSQSNLRSNR